MSFVCFIVINEAAKNQVIGIAAISLWEISMLVEKEGIKLAKPLLSWIQEALALLGVELKALTQKLQLKVHNFLTFMASQQIG